MAAAASSSLASDREARAAFIEITGAHEIQADEYLQKSQNNLEVALAAYYQDSEEVSGARGCIVERGARREHQYMHDKKWRQGEGRNSWWGSNWSGWSSWDWNDSAWRGKIWAADVRVGFYDTDGDYCEYAFRGIRGQLDVYVNGEFTQPTTWIECMEPPLRKCFDATGSLTLPGRVYEKVVQALIRVCRKADVRFELREAPEEIPWGPAQPRSICIRLTVGDLIDYHRESLLHVGISDSLGKVTHFPANVVYDRDVWSECISVALPLSDLQDDEWDLQMKVFVASEREQLKIEPYMSLSNNCFSFCARFFNQISYSGSCSHSKDELVQQHGIAEAIERLETFLTKLQAVADRELSSRR